MTQPEGVTKAKLRRAIQVAEEQGFRVLKVRVRRDGFDLELGSPQGVEKPLETEEEVIL